MGDIKPEAEIRFSSIAMMLIGGLAAASIGLDWLFGCFVMTG